MQDHEVVAAFVSAGARKAFGPALHIEGDALFLAGWWQAAFRIAPDVFVVRNEEAPKSPELVAQVADALSARGLNNVGVNLPAVTAIIYAELSLGDVSWTLWSSDMGAGERALATRATTESFFADQSSGDPESLVEFADFSAELGGARQIAGLPASLVLTVGLRPDEVLQLEASLEDCRLVSRTFQEISPGACGGLIPTMIVVDASGDAGQDFIGGLRADASCRFLPVAALMAQPSSVAGADITLDRADPPSSWVASLRRVLP